MTNEKRLDLIDRNELLPNGVFYVNGDDPMTSLDELLSRIANTKTVDTVEVVHGNWTPLKFPLTRCTVCGVVRNSVYDTGWNYCPNCGAKMDGERREGE